MHLEKRTLPLMVEVWGDRLWKHKDGLVGVCCNMFVVVGATRARGHVSSA